MLALLLALVVGPAVQEAPLPQAAPPQAPTVAHSGDLTVGQGGVALGLSDGRPSGQVMLIIDNGGADTDRIVSIRTPIGTVGDIGVYHVAGPRTGRAPDGDVSVQPGRTGVVADLVDVTTMEVASTIVTVVFEHAGEVTIQAVPNYPVAAPPPPPAAH